MKPLELLAIGDATAPWAGRLREALATAGRLRAVATLAESLPGLAERQPRLVVLITQRPGEHCPRQLLKLRQLAPLARLVSVTSSWCEAEGRSGHPLPGVERVAWHEWPRLLEEYLAARANQQPHAWTAPPTQSRDEAALAESKLPRPALVHAGTRPAVAIAAATSSAYEPLADACRVVGYAPAWLRREAPSLLEPPAVLVWDAVHLGRAQLAELAEWQRLYPTLPLLAVAGFPRPHDLALLQAAGATAVLAKPLSLHALWRQLSLANGGEMQQPAAKAPLVAAA